MVGGFYELKKEYLSRVHILQTLITSSPQARHGETALHAAFAADQEDCARQLLSAGAQVDVCDRCNPLAPILVICTLAETVFRFQQNPMTMAGPTMTAVVRSVGMERHSKATM